MDDDTVDEIAELARSLVGEHDVLEVLARVVEAGVIEVDGAADAGITLVDKGGVSTPVFSSALVVAVDQEQYSTGQGPCMSASAGESAVVRSDDLSMDPRWPVFAERANALGVQSMVSFQLFADDHTIGALNMYCATPNGFSDDAVHVGEVLAAHAAVACKAAMKVTNMRAALGTRDVIGVAKGILMERYKITDIEAFNLLVAASQKTRVKLSRLADELAATGVFQVGNGKSPPDDTPRDNGSANP